MKFSVDKRKWVSAALIAAGAFGFLIWANARFNTENGFLTARYVLCFVMVGLAAFLKLVQLPEQLTKNAVFSYSVSTLLAVPIFTMMELLNGNVYANLWKWSIWFNLILIWLVIWLIYAICRRFTLSLRITLVICYIAALANDIVIEFRGQPISALDIFSWQTAASVAGRYRYSFNADWCIATALMLLIWTLAGLAQCRMHGKKSYIANLAFCIVCVSGFFYVFFETDLLADLKIKDYLWNQRLAFEDNGVLLSMVYSTRYLMVDVADNYSPELAADIMESTARKQKEDSGVRPNIIAIMNESFADLSVVGDLETTEDPLPFYHSLIGAPNTVTGNLVVSTFGGGTCNTEYEFLTGASLAFFPTGSVVYQQYIPNELPSLVSTLQSQGYASAAVHPFYAYCWNRQKIYPLLGFDRFLSIDDFENPRTVGGYMGNSISDESDYDKLIELYENKAEDTPLFIFNVTMQNHGGYSKVAGCDTQIDITNLNTNFQDAENYLSLVKESDTQLQRLVDYFAKVDEPTVIVFFGDHQPNLSDAFYQQLYGKDTTNLTISELQNKYKTPFVIWANYDIGTEELGDLSANYLSTLVLEKSGLQLPLYNRYLSRLRSRMPVINLYGYQLPDGTDHTFDETTKASDLIADYRIVQYNLMFDSKNRLNDAFTLQ